MADVSLQVDIITIFAKSAQFVSTCHIAASHHTVYLLYEVSYLPSALYAMQQPAGREPPAGVPAAVT